MTTVAGGTKLFLLVESEATVHQLAHRAFEIAASSLVSAIAINLTKMVFPCKRSITKVANC